MQSLLLRQLRQRLCSEVIDGSLSTHRVPCGSAKCGCATDPEQRHVKYRMTKKVAGKTVSTYVPKGQADGVREWSDNYRAAQALLKELAAISHAMIGAVSRERALMRRTAKRLKRVD